MSVTVTAAREPFDMSMTVTAAAREPFESWAILELLGHRRLGGYVREQELAGHGFLRIDIPSPSGEGTATQFVSPSSVYALTPTTEETARAVARVSQPAPVSRWELPPPPAMFRCPSCGTTTHNLCPACDTRHPCVCMQDANGDQGQGGRY